MKTLVLGGYGKFGARISRALGDDPAITLLVGGRMAALATQAHCEGSALPPSYVRYQRWWERLGYPAFAAMVLIFYLMVNKPALWR